MLARDINISGLPFLISASNKKVQSDDG